MSRLRRSLLLYRMMSVPWLAEAYRVMAGMTAQVSEMTVLAETASGEAAGRAGHDDDVGQRSRSPVLVPVGAVPGVGHGPGLGRRSSRSAPPLGSRAMSRSAS